jgi:signal transduction histidine kinase/ligand-binding sensor domain-containing protein/DNA-binding response OmpR family regulator
MKWFFLNVCCFWSIFLVSLDGLAQREPDQFRFQHITVNEGLSHSDAMCVTQDNAGFIWIGTNKGINRYDGYSLKKYDLPINDQDGIAGNRIRTLEIDRQGKLWVGVERSGVFWYDDSRDRFVSIRELAGASDFSPYLHQLTHTNVHAIRVDRQNRIWVATQHYGVFVLQTDRAGKLSTIRQIGLTNRSKAEPLVNRLAVDNRGRVWIGTLGDGLWVFDGNGQLSPNVPLRARPVSSFSDTNIRALHLDIRGDLWIGTDSQIFWMSQKALSRVPGLEAKPLRRTFAAIESLFLDSSKRLWISTNYGLLLMDAGRVTGAGPPINEQAVQTFLPLDTDPTSINSVRVHDLLEDRFHNLWLATSAGGLNRLNLRTKAFGHIRRQMVGQTTPANNYINTIWKDEKNKQLWMGTRNGFASYDLSRKTYRNYLNRALSGNVNGIDVSTLFQATDGTLWIGTRYYGLYTLKTQPGSPPVRLPAVPDVGNTSIESIVEDRHGSIWVATFSTGIHQFTRQGKHLKTYDTLHNALPTYQFTALLYDRSRDILWASTRDAGVLKMQISPTGLHLLSQFRHEPRNPNSLRTNYAWPLLKDRQGTLWIGTIGGGLHRLTTTAAGKETIERYSQWVPETDVESLLTDEAGNLWIGGAGLYTFNPTSKRLFHYGVTDGLQSNSFKIGAAYRAADGTLYVGGTNGITYFQPRTLTPNPYPPLVQITELRILNQLVGIGDTLNGRILLEKPFSELQTIRLKASENDFSIEFVGLNYANPQKQQYRYRLVGYKADWVQAAPGQRTVNFSNLPAGEYTFMVKASNDDGVWSVKPALLQFTILPPWWRTWWAYLLYAAAVVGVFWFYQRNELAKQELKNKLVLEQYKVEKEKDVTDTKLRFFTNVSHELRTPLTLILGPLEELASSGGALPAAKDKIMLMHQQTRKLLDLVNQLMDFRKVESGHVSLRASPGNMMAFLTEIFLIFKLKAEELQLDYTMEAPAADIFMYFDRSKVEIILTNLLSNAVKFTPEGGKIRVVVSVVGSPENAAVFREGTLQTNYLEVVVRDWGVGMNADEVDKIFDPYYQASHTETMRMTGTGIGLSLVKQFVEAHAGEVTVQSAPGAGTMFTLRFPFGSEHLPPEAIRDEPSSSENPVALRRDIPEYDLPDTTSEPAPVVVSARVLLVEDNEELRQYLQQLFAPTFEVFVAVDGLEGWEKTLDILPDLIVSDVMMPRSNGLELCKKIKQHPKTMHIPVVLLTARAAAMHELEGLETGADEYMAKPFNPRLLYTKIAVMLQSRHRLKEYYQRQILLKPTDIVIPDDQKRLLEKAMGIVEAHLADSDFSVPMLVREMGMSQSTFYRQIKAMTGQSVVEFIRDVRIKRAAQLLTTTSLRVSEIANQVGFDDLKHFRKTFQSLYTLSPSEYARQHREGAIADT